MITDISGISRLKKVSKPEEGHRRADGGTGKNQPQGSWSVPEWKQLQPIEEERSNRGDPCEQAGRKGYPETEALDGEIDEMDSPTGIFMHQSGAVEPVLCELPERFPGLILLCEITNENANAQFFRPLFAKGSSFQP